MRSRIIHIMIISIVILLIIDIYAYRGIILLAGNIISEKERLLLNIIYWIIPVVLITGLIYFSRNLNQINTKAFASFFNLTGFFILVYIPKLVFIIFQLFRDLTSLFFRLTDLLTGIDIVSGHTFSIVLRTISITGTVLCSMSFGIILHGILFGRFTYTVRNIELFPDHLPDALDGARLVHISDIHIGSLWGYKNRFKKAIDLINSLNADLIFFTGDLVNNFAEELDGWIPLLGKMSSRYGKFSILGNHDYGDYFNWADDLAKQENLNRIIQAHSACGFRLLLNESEKVRINGHSLNILGVENWGLPPFKQHGDLEKAMKGLNDSGFKILLSHDPSHWDAEVAGKTNIDITLSGHTHGMQFGIRTKKLRWSPISLMYRRWGGLYKTGNQILYVNTGLGYIGFPGRIGIPPEIAVIHLKK